MNGRCGSLVIGIVSVALVIAAGCHRVRPVAPPPPAPVQPLAMSSPPVVRQTETVTPAPEPRISLAGTNWDVRDVLRAIADKGGYTLVLSPEINKRVTVDFTNVPVSEAFRAVLEAANLTLQTSTTGKIQLPYNPNVVFYQLPVNVDSLPADVIMKRFGVSRQIADLIVKSRMP
jgi:hypothetical protein